MPAPASPKIYHIVHVNRLASIVADGGLLCDATVMREGRAGAAIGMSDIKRRRLDELRLTSHPGLFVGECVPFYFCSRSVMLYVIHQANHPELAYRDGQDPVIHLEADLRQSVEWAERNDRRWAFTLSNAGSFYFRDRCDLAHLDEINWDAVRARRWAGNGIPQSMKEGKQAEFLVERSFAWELVERIGVRSRMVAGQVHAALGAGEHKPHVEIKPGWYY